MPLLLYICIFFSDFKCFNMSLLLLTVTLRGGGGGGGGSNKHCLLPLFSLNRSSSFLQVTRTCMKAWMSLNFGQIPPPTPELSALAGLKN